MKEFKFLHCADIHLDAPFTSLGADSGKSKERRQDLKQSVVSIVDIAIHEGVDLLLICGDLYEQNYVNKSTIKFINDQFNRIPEIEIFILPGNHDPYISNSYYKNYIWSDNVHLLTCEEPFHVLKELNVCVSSLNKLNSASEEPINILMIHGTLDMNVGKNIYNYVTSEELAGLGMDYIALGHFHKKFEAMGSKNNIYNPGSPEPLGFDEPGAHGVLLGTISKKGGVKSEIRVDFIELNKKTYLSIDIDITNLSTDEEIVSKLWGFITKNCNKNYLLAINLVGYLDQEYKPDLQFIISSLEELVYFLKISDNTSMDYNFNTLSQEPGLRGLFVRKMLSRINNSGDDSERKILERALYYGLEALEKGEINC